MRKKYLYPFILFFISLALLITNYKQGTFLIGWDTIMPELSLGLNLKRSLFGVWQDYRGLGFLDGQSYVANLIYTIFASVLWVLLQLNQIRYVAIIFLHFIGGLGFYYLAKKLTKNNEVAFLGSLFYLFNLGTIQQFFAPLETFAFHFAFLPWLFWSGLNYLHNKDKKSLLLFFLTALLSTPQAFVPTLFMTFSIAFGTLLFLDIIINRTAKYFVILSTALLIVNSFWLISFMYGLPKNAPTIKNARINEYSSEQVYLRNKARGDIGDVLSLKGFMMDAQEWNAQKNINESFLAAWDTYTNGPIYIGSYVLIFALALLGIVRGYKDKQRLVFMFPLLISFFFLANNTPIIQEVGALVRSSFPMLGEALRFPFTKFITIFVFSLSLFFTFGIEHLILFFKKKKIVYIAVLTAIILIALPAFQGNFFSSLLKQKIPQEYFQAMDYFQKQDPNKRIAILPAYTFWSWQYRRWGYVGSGFLWYGIPQSIMQRAFDPWSGYNEQFYNELAFAFKKEDQTMLNNVLGKYNIDYLFLDKNIINNLSTKPINYDQIERLLNDDESLTKDAQWKDLIVYKTNNSGHNQFVSLLNNPTSISPQASYYYEDTIYKTHGDYVTDEQTPQQINLLPALFTEKTQADLEFAAQEQNSSILFTPKNNPFNKLTKEGYYNLAIPSIFNTYLIPATITNEGGKVIVTIIPPSVVIDGTEYKLGKTTIQVPLLTIKNPISFRLGESNQNFKASDTFYLLRDYPNTLQVTDSDGSSELTQVNLTNIPTNPDVVNVLIKPTSTLQVVIPKIKSDFSFEHLVENGEYTIVGDKKNIRQDGGVTISTGEDKTEVVFYKENMPHQSAYIFFSKTSWATGLPLDFYIDNQYAGRSELETKISKEKDFNNVIILPPTQNVYSGYGMHFVADPVGNQQIETKIQSLSFYPVPWEVLTGINLTVDELRVEKTTPMTTSIQVNKKGPYLYDIILESAPAGQNNEVLTLSQAFHTGWKAYEVSDFNFISENLPFIVGKEIKDHILVNNWANGWKITNPNQQNIVIVFWPQYLEFVGFGLLTVTFLILVTRRK